MSYLLQYLSDDGMNEDMKPMSASYLERPQEGLVYRVVEEGVIRTDHQVVLPIEHWVR
jgi:hypothetical protein